MKLFRSKQDTVVSSDFSKADVRDRINTRLNELGVEPDPYTPRCVRIEYLTRVDPLDGEQHEMLLAEFADGTGRYTYKSGEIFRYETINLLELIRRREAALASGYSIF